MSEAKAENGGMDLLQGPLLKKIILFAIPIACSSILQQLFNFADVAVVGHFAGSEAMAAVGANSPIINLFVNLFVGLSVGANVIIARSIGEGRQERIHDAVQTSVVVAILSGIAALLLGMFLAVPMHRLIATPENVRKEALIYLRIYCSFAPFYLLYNFGAAILRSIGDTKRPLYCLVVGGVLNVLLNLLLVIVFKLGVIGVAVATGVSNVVSSVMVLRYLCKGIGPIKLEIHRLYVRKEALVPLLRVGVPAGFQTMLFSISNVVIQSSVNTFGAAGIAGTTTAVNFDMISYFFMMAFVQATVTFISQNYGAGNMERCKRVFWLSTACSLVVCAVFNIVIALGAGLFVHIFTDDPAVIEFAVYRMRYVHVVHWLVISYEMTAGAMRGLGYSLIPAIIVVFGTCLFRIVWVMTVFRHFRSYPALVMAYPATWILAGTMMSIACILVFKRARAKLEKTV